MHCSFGYPCGAISSGFVVQKAHCCYWCVLCRLFFRIPRSDVEEAVVELLQLCQKDPQRHVTQRPQQACVSHSDCSKVLYVGLHFAP